MNCIDEPTLLGTLLERLDPEKRAEVITYIKDNGDKDIYDIHNGLLIRFKKWGTILKEEDLINAINNANSRSATPILPDNNPKS